MISDSRAYRFLLRQVGIGRSGLTADQAPHGLEVPAGSGRSLRDKDKLLREVGGRVMGVFVAGEQRRRVRTGRPSRTASGRRTSSAANSSA